MSDFSSIKKKLGLSTTLPAGMGAVPSYVTGSNLQGHTHGAGCGCSHSHADDDEENEES
jgi:ABC-type nickel/cobalt efflux system permease component RcnA